MKKCFAFLLLLIIAHQNKTHAFIPYSAMHAQAMLTEGRFIDDIIDLFKGPQPKNTECKGCSHAVGETLFESNDRWFSAHFASQTCCRGAQEHCFICLIQYQNIFKDAAPCCSDCETPLPPVVFTPLFHNPTKEDMMPLCIGCMQSPMMRHIFSCDHSRYLYNLAYKPVCDHWKEYCFRCLAIYENQQRHKNTTIKCPLTSCHEEFPGIVKKPIFF